MGLIDNIRGLFSSSRNNETAQPQVDEEYEKLRLANKIVNLVSNIKRINSFDSSIWNLSNVSTYDLQHKSLSELQALNSTLENRLLELSKKQQTTDRTRESLEAAKWTGRKPENMTDHDFDRFQRE